MNLEPIETIPTPKALRLQWSFLICPVLVAMVWIVYAQTLTFDFVYLDDHKYVTQNRHLREGLSLENLSWSFTTTYFLNYHPLTWLSYLTDVEVYGEDAKGFHLTNVVIHTANVLLLFAVLRVFTRTTWRGACVAAIFAVHPIHVESVAWISERKDVLSVFFGLLAILAYGLYSQKFRWKWYILTVLTFTLSLLSKQTLVTLPAVFLLLDYWPLGRFSRNDLKSAFASRFSGSKTKLAGRTDNTAENDSSTGTNFKRLLLEKIPFCVIAIVFCAIIYQAQQTGGSVVTVSHFPVSARLLNATVAYGEYLGKLAWPVELCAFYPFPRDGISLFHVLAAIVVLCSLTVVAVLLRRRPYLLVGWLWFLGTLLPMIGLIQIGSQHMADRYLYFPAIGIYIAVVWFVSSLAAARRSKIIAALVCGSLLIVVTAQAHVQARSWKNSESLARRMLEVAPANNISAQLIIADALFAKGHIDAAIRGYRKCVLIDFNSIHAHHNLGRALTRKGDLDGALKHYEFALTLVHAENGGTDALEIGKLTTNYGTALFAKGRIDEAMNHLQEAIRLAPEYSTASINLAVAYFKQEQFDRAIVAFRQALKIDPHHHEAKNGLVVSYIRFGEQLEAAGNPSDAAIQFREALRMDPDDRTAREHLKTLHKQQPDN